MLKVAIIDFGAGNLCSAYNAIARIVGEGVVDIVTDVDSFSEYSHIIMPGVGAFDHAMENLSKRSGLVYALRVAVLEDKKPFLGICIGMQILLEEGYENKVVKGLGWLPGKVKRFVSDEAGGCKIPHMGWNNLSATQDVGVSKFLDKDFYFVHSYYVTDVMGEDVIATCDYIKDFPAVIGRENIIATQFHPEKSGEAGQAFLKFFLQVKQ